jgi:hypothetical protein
MIIPYKYKDRITHYLIEFKDEFERTDVDIPFCELQLEEMLETFKDFKNENPPKDWYDYHGISIIRRAEEE